MSDKEYMHISDREPDFLLLIRYIQGVLPDEEMRYITKWLEAGTDNEKILLQTAQIYYAQRTKQRIQARDSKAAFNRVQQQLRKKAQKVLLLRFWMVAGCIALFVSVVLNYYHYQWKHEEPVVQYITMQTNAGMRSDIILPDGTEVFLNSASKLSYPVSFDGDERRVELDGEAYFKVVHHAQQPFIVGAAEKAFEVEVLGTEFNIQAYTSDEILRTTLVEGSIRLGIETAPGIKEYTTLQPSQKACYNVKTKSLCVDHVNTIYDTAWKKGKLMFKETPLPEVLNRLSHFYNVQFQVDEPMINKYTFTGTFENRQLSQILDYLSISSRIKYKIVMPEEDDSEEPKQTRVILTK